MQKRGNAAISSEVTFTTKHALRIVPAMGKKKQTSRQVSVRLPIDIADRLDKTADMLSIDTSALIKLLIVEGLPDYEAKARKARGVRGEHEA